MNHKSFFKTVAAIAIPVALQSMLQSSFSMIDQVMVGQLGSTGIAAIGIAGKFAFMYSTVIGAVSAIAGIMIAQYMGQKNPRWADHSLCVNLLAATALGGVFTLLSLLLPAPIMGLYTKDAATVREAAAYLRIISATYLPMGAASMLAAMLRCNDRAGAPLAASVASAVVNTGLNYLLIFGRLGLPRLGIRGAAIASAACQLVNLALMALSWRRMIRARETPFQPSVRMDGAAVRQYLGMLLPLLVTEFLWSLGQNVNALIYGHLGTLPLAAVSLISPVESLLIGALSGIAQAAGILIGKRLGEANHAAAYDESRRLMRYGFIGSMALSALLVALRGYYVRIFNVEREVLDAARALLVVFAVLAPFKVQNMILGGGIIRSGGMTRYVMWIDLMGTWLLGVPLGLLAAFALRLDVVWIYAVIGFEEIVRWLVSVGLFRSRKWMVTL